LNFEDDDYQIIVSWDRILIKGQQSIDKYCENNSPLETPFATILDSIKSLDEFGSVQNALLAVNHVKKIEGEPADSVSLIKEKTLTADSINVIPNMTDIAIQLDNKGDGTEESIIFGPYLGPFEILRRNIQPVNIDSLEEIDYSGLMMECKIFKTTSVSNFDLFKELVEKSNALVDKACQIVQ
jgi:hypothetical protein